MLGEKSHEDLKTAAQNWQADLQPGARSIQPTGHSLPSTGPAVGRRLHRRQSHKSAALITPLLYAAAREKLVPEEIVMVKYYDLIHACGHRHRYPASETAEIALLDGCAQCTELVKFQAIRNETIVIDIESYRSIGLSQRRR